MYPIVIGICGKSAAGKDSTATRLVEEYKKIGIPAKKVISYTTRPPREGEVDGVDYHSLTQRLSLKCNMMISLLNTLNFAVGDMAPQSIHLMMIA